MATDEAEAPLVPALFADRDTAAKAIEELLRAGIDRGDIGVAVPVREPNRLREESPQDSVQGAAVGASIGGRLGVLGGIGLAALTVGSLGVGGLFLAGAAGLLWGGTIGGLLGVVTRVRRRPDLDEWCELSLDDKNVMVAVRVRDWAREPEIAALLTQAGAVSVNDHPEYDHTWQELEIAHRTGMPAPS
ncbi:MAG TPA: hypothetical protein VGK33_03235 [Chloroflexota bacterium]